MENFIIVIYLPTNIPTDSVKYLNTNDNEQGSKILIFTAALTSVTSYVDCVYRVRLA